MSFRYWVVYKHGAGDMDSAEITTSHELDNARGRIEAQKILAGQGVPDPTITGWTLRGADQGEQS